MKLIITIFTFIMPALLACTVSAQANGGKIKIDVICSDCYQGQIPIEIPRPEFPNAAKLVHAVGRVDVQILIDEKGNVLKANAVSGHLLLRSAAVKAALKAKFKPATLGNQRVKFVEIISYNFIADFQTQSNSIKIGSQSPFSTVASNLKEQPQKIIKGQALSLPKPSFPNCNCKFLSKINKVLVEVKIDVYGNVVSTKALTGHPALRNGSEAAARFSKFSQTKISSIPVKARAQITYEYIFKRRMTINVIVSRIEPQK